MTIDFGNDWIFTNSAGEKRSVSIPHDAMILEQRSPSCHNGANTGFFPGGKYKYEKEFLISGGDVDKEIKILFEAVYRNATVLINDIEAARHAYGYTEFTVDLTGKVTAGNNKITVIADNSLEPNSRWYSGSGIIRPVSLSIMDKIHPSVLRIKTVSVNPAVISVITDGEASLRIYAPDGSEVEIEVTGINKLSGGLSERLIKVEDARLWSTESPDLYGCEACLGSETLKSAFGIRLLTWDAENGMCINGERVLLRGGCIHHDNGVLGACGYADAEWRRVRILKEAGYNALRMAHNPASRAMLDACDRLGMLVMDEAFDGWYIPKTYHDYARDFWENYKNDLKAMVDRDINHPCVIMYSIGNEVSETASEKGVLLAGDMSEYVKSLDDTRPATAGINVLLNVYTNMGMGVYKDKGIYKRAPLPPKNKKYKEKKTGSAFFNSMAGKLGGLMFFMSAGKKGERASAPVAEKLDILGLNYAGSRFGPDLKKYPERLMAASETMVTDLPYNWKYIEKHPQILGDFVWAAWDYLGEAGIGDYMYASYPGLPIAAGSGTIDLTGKMGSEVFYEQVIWGLRDKPYIGVAPLNHNGETPVKSAWRFTNSIDSWNWQGYEGEKAEIEVFAQGAYVRLYLNGRLVGEKPLKGYKCSFRTAYVPGELTARALDENKRVISEHTLSSGYGRVSLSVNIEYGVNKQLAFLETEFKDEAGKLRADMEDKVCIGYDGEESGVRLAGMGSAICKTDESYQGNGFHAYRGRLIAVFDISKKKKDARVKISSGHVESIYLML